MKSNRHVLAGILIPVLLITGAYSYGRRDAPNGETKHPFSEDADGFIWGTEAGVVHTPDVSGLSSDKQIQCATRAVNDVLRTRYVKIRLHQPEDASRLPMFPNVTPRDRTPQWSNLDDMARVFQQNGWSMFPMFSVSPGKFREGASYLRGYTDFIDWFLGRYKDTARIKYIELHNAPAKTWRGTEEELLELQNTVYDRIKKKYPDVYIGTVGFEYFMDQADDSQLRQLEYFFDKGAKFDFWAFHGYKTARMAGRGGAMRSDYPPALPPRGGRFGVRPRMPLVRGRTEQRGGGSRSEYPPTTSPRENKYAGIPGILEIRKRMDQNGWTDRFIMDTESVYLGHKDNLDASSDKLSAAYMVQDLIIKKTLRYKGKPVLRGVFPLKIRPRAEALPDGPWSSLYPDGSMTLTVEALGLLWSFLDSYRYDSHVSGRFDEERIPWVERFVHDDGSELYIYFKPFTFREGGAPAIGPDTARHSLKLKRRPLAIVSTDLYGNESNIPPATSLLLEATNEPKFMVVRYANAGKGP